MAPRPGHDRAHLRPPDRPVGHARPDRTGPRDLGRPPPQADPVGCGSDPDHPHRHRGARTPAPRLPRQRAGSRRRGAHPARSAGEVSAPVKEPAHILIVDDDDRIRDLTKRFLTLKGFRVSAAADAAGARRLMENLNFDLAILDVMMPGEDGLSLLTSIRKGPARETPVMLLTARGQTRDRIEGLRTGADDYL